MKEILKDEYITITSTEHDFDIIAIIENNSNELIRFETNGEDLFCIEPKKYIGLLASISERAIFQTLKDNQYYRYICEDSISYELNENYYFNLLEVEQWKYIKQNGIYILQQAIFMASILFLKMENV